MKKRLAYLLLLVSAFIVAPNFFVPGGAGTSRASHAAAAAEGETRTFTLPRRAFGPAPQDGMRLSPNPAQGALTLKAARRGHTSTPLGAGRVLIVGGQNEAGMVREVEFVDAAAKQVNAVATLSAPRSRHTATLLQGGHVFVAGGWDRSQLLDTTGFFDPSTNAFADGPRLHRARAAHNTTALPDGRVLITGGRPDSTAELLDPNAQTLTLLAAKLSAPRSFHAAAVLKDGTVLLAGGVGPEGEPLGSAEVFDPRTLTFTPTRGPMTIRRVRPDLRVLPDGKVQVIGGDYDGTMEIYDPARDAFHAPAHLLPTADIFPGANVLSARTRGAYIDAKIPKAGANTQARIYTPTGQQALQPFKAILDRADYSTAELSDRDETVMTGGVNRGGQLLNSVLVFAGSTGTISTVKTEYLEGEQPVVTGAGWQPFEAVRVVRQEARPGHKRLAFSAVADAQGNFTSTDIPLGAYQEGVTYTLTALGRSGSLAQTAYKDAPPLDPSKRKPRREIKYSAPLLSRDASYEHEDGILIIRPRKPLPNQVKPPELPSPSAAFDVAISFDAAFDLIEDRDCFGLDAGCASPIPAFRIPCACGDNLDLRLMPGSSLTAAFSLDGSAIIEDANDNGFDDKVTTSVRLTESLSGKFNFRVTAKGSFTKTVPIPFTSLEFEVEIGDLLGGTLTVGVVAKAVLELNDPGTTFTTGIAFSETATVGITAVADDSGPNLVTSITPTATANASFTPEFNLESTEGGCVTLLIGPEATASLTADFGICEVGPTATLGAFDFFEICLNGSTSGLCSGFNVPMSAGVRLTAEANVDLCSFIFGDAANLQLLARQFEPVRFQLANFQIGTPDTTPPVFTPKPDVQVSADPNSCFAYVDFDPPDVSDNCSIGQASIDLECSGHPPSLLFPKGTTPVTCTATDAAGNRASTAFNVIVRDATAPSLSAMPDFVARTSPGSCEAAVNFPLPAFADNCDLQPTNYSCTKATGSVFQKGATPVTCTASDSSGNSASSTFNVVVRDEEKPLLTPVANIVANTDLGSCTAVVNFAATAADNCSGVTVVSDPPPGFAFPKGTTTVTNTATDASGNKSTSTFTVTVQDKEAPVINPVANIVVFATPGSCNVPVGYLVTANDNCPGVTVVSSPPSGTAFPKGVNVVTNTARDAAGNVSTSTFTVTVLDKEPPVISNVSASPTELSPANHKMREVTVEYTVADNCPLSASPCALSVTSNEPIDGKADGNTEPDWEVVDVHHLLLRAERSAQGDGRIYTIAVTCTDASGNQSVKTTTVTVPRR